MLDFSTADAVVADAAHRGDVPGAVTLVCRDGEIVHHAAFGRQDVDGRVPMRPDTLFRIYSMTKPIAAAATLMLAEDGRLALEDPVDRWIPELAHPRVLRRPDGPLADADPASRPITVLDLLTHRSGLGYNFTTAGPLSAALTAVHQSAVSRPDDWLRQLGQLPLACAPGSRFQYGLSTDVLGVLLSRVANQPLTELLRDRLFDPLDMVDTTFTATAEQFPRLGPCYAVRPETGQVVVDDAGGAASRWATPPVVPSAGGGLLSTATDYAAFADLLLAGGVTRDGRRLLSAESVRRMTAIHMTADQRRVPFKVVDFWAAQGMGLSVAVFDADPAAGDPIQNGASAGSFYWPGLAGTWWLADPAHRAVLVFLVQLKGGSQRSPVRAFQRAVYTTIDGPNASAAAGP